MSLSRVFSPILHFEDINGRPLVGGKLYTYIAGTSTKVSTYRNSENTEYNENPILLNERGECEVWIESSIRYKFKLCDCMDNVIWTKDDITAPGVVVMPDTKEVLVTGSTPVLVNAVTNNGITTFTVSLSSDFVNQVSSNASAISAEVGRAQGAERLLNTAIGNEALRAAGKEGELARAIENEESRAKSAEKAAKTVVRNVDGTIEVIESTGENGQMIYTLKGVESVPNVNITSPNRTINISSSEDQTTNTKTFEIDVKLNPISVGWFDSDTMSYDSSKNAYTTGYFDLINNGNENPQGDKISYSVANHSVSLDTGLYHIDIKYEFNWTGDVSNEIIYLAGHPFDLSYQHKEVFSYSNIIQASALTPINLTCPVSKNPPPEGIEIKAVSVSIYSISQVMENVVDGIKEVKHDDSLTGKGTDEEQLSVVYLRDVGALTDAASVDVTNNATQHLTSAQTALTLNVNCVAGEVPNFAVEISASAAITLTLTKTVNNVATTLYPSEAGGTALESGKYYQVTCVGNCWTLAEFVPPSP